MTDGFLWALGGSALVAVIVAVAGGVLTETGPWYAQLKKPSWKPPDWAFGPVWTVILVLSAISAALAWEAAEGAGGRSAVLAVLIINSILNIAWSGIFFKLRRPDWALVEVAMLWLSILSLILVLGSYSTIAGLLMLPYLAWVSTAMFLNYRIVQMNKPFA
ncbi:TspO/MBR family protein [Aestuariivirga sp.]|jgi:tryptophan-rich sensory protein|uniref:TspO/MBR family protein n=1 Tax=Aestuariivirga sp. TaxID=2650926 RepID=UPI0037841B27